MIQGWQYLESSSQSSCIQEHQVWVAHALEKMESIKTGMTRADLLKVFRSEGGLSTGLHRTFASRDCAYFKVTLNFRLSVDRRHISHRRSAAPERSDSIVSSESCCCRKAPVSSDPEPRSYNWLAPDWPPRTAPVWLKRPGKSPARGRRTVADITKPRVPESYQRTTRVDAKFFFMYSPRLTSAAPMPMRPAKCTHDTYFYDATSRRGSCFLLAGAARGDYSH
jgi:hypothetical protein